MPTSKTSSATRAPDSATSTGLSEHVCHQIALATESAAICCRSWESLQQVHQHSAQRTALRLQQAAEQMRRMTHAAELMGIHSVLMASSLQEMSQLMQDLTLSNLRLQGALLTKQQEASMAASSSLGDSSSQESSPASTTTVETMNAANEAAHAASAATAALWKSWSSMMGSAPAAPSNSAGRGSRHH